MLSQNKEDYKEYYSSISEKTKEFEGREWLFSIINGWVQDNNGARYFLITGKAGTGKSAIAARLWEKYEYKNVQSSQKYKMEKGFISAIHVCSD